MRARAHTARTDRSRHARHDHGVHGSVTARTPRCTVRTPRSRRARFGHGAHASVTACTSRSLCARRGTAGTVGTAGPAASATRLLQRVQRSGWRSGGRRGAAEGLSSVARGAAEGLSSVARGDGDFGRASGRFTSGRYQHSEGLRPGPRARRLSEGRPATAVTAGTAADHGGHAPITTFAALITEIPVTWSGQRARSPRRPPPPRQRLSPGWAGRTKSTSGSDSCSFARRFVQVDFPLKRNASLVASKNS
jgi:hypothetical protein